MILTTRIIVLSETSNHRSCRSASECSCFRTHPSVWPYLASIKISRCYHGRFKQTNTHTHTHKRTLLKTTAGCNYNYLIQWTLYSSEAIIVPHEIIWIWYTGRWLVGCHIWYSQETTGRGPQPAQAPPHCTSHRPIFTILGEMTHAHKRANPIQCIMGATGQTSGCGFGLTMIRVFDWATVWWRKYVWPYVKLFQQNTGTWWTNGQTDRQTDRQNCYINIARQCAGWRAIITMWYVHSPPCLLLIMPRITKWMFGYIASCCSVYTERREVTKRPSIIYRAPKYRDDQHITGVVLVSFIHYCHSLVLFSAYLANKRLHYRNL